MEKEAKKLWLAFPAGSEERKRIKRAYGLAVKAHAEQKRTSGVPYIVHPVAVARKVQDFGLDAESIIVALLHDVVEDTTYSLAEIEESFGAEVARMVDALTKVETIRYKKDDLHKAETYRKIILATAKDIRVVIIKLMDRLHNISTAEAFPPERKQRYAEETLQVYAPIAHRLGFAKIKEELEDHAFQLIDPEAYEETKAIIAKLASESEKVLAELTTVLKADLTRNGLKNFKILSRQKSPYSLHEKLAAGEHSYQDIYDILGLRIITEDLEGCYIALGRVHTLWHPLPGRFYDHIANPKSNMYQSLHTTVSSDKGIVFEVQIRSWEMHAIAEYGLAAHWHYKEVRRDKMAAIDAWLQTLAEQQQVITSPDEMLEALISETSKDEIYTFTPEGNVRVLPLHATPVDFAYAIHSSVGNRCVGAKVNGRIVPLQHQLNNGDIVEIMTTKSEDARPRVDWLRFVVTQKAKTHIRKSTQKEARAADEQKGLRLLQDALRKRKLSLNMDKVWTEEVLKGLHCASREDLYYKVGTAKLNIKQVVKQIMPPEAIIPAVTVKPVPAKRKQTSAVILDGQNLEGVPFSMAGCCNPLPGDEISGYVSLGRGVIVHRASCSNLQPLEKQRVFPARWSEKSGQDTFLCSLRIHAWDRPRLLEDISHVLAERGSSLSEVDLRSDQELVRGQISLELAEVDGLINIIAELRSLEGVTLVERL